MTGGHDMVSDYKMAKEAFVSGMTGSSIGHINMLSLAAWSSIALHSALRTRLPHSKSALFSLDLTILVLPLLLSITLFANSPGLLNLILLVPTALLLLLPHREFGTPLPSNISLSHGSPTVQERRRMSVTSRESENIAATATSPLPSLTTYRAHMLLLTFLSILAVDFPVFPRALAKCETFGVSLMDLGVGSFVFSQGIVSAVPLVRNPAYLTQPFVRKVLTVARKCLPVLIIGLLRTLSVKGVEYPEHQTEYGTHWNFFMTLALIPILQVILHPLIMYLPISFLGVLVAVLHQFTLRWGLMDFVLNAPRIDAVSHNKEGIVSLTGYLAIHLLGLSTGTVILPPTPSYFRRRLQQLARPQSLARTHNDSDSESDEDASSPAKVQRPHAELGQRENDKTAIELCSYAVLWWALLGALKIFDVGGGVSRRMVNLQYIAWVAAYNTTFLLGYLFLDLMFFSSPFSKSVYSPVSKLKVRPDTTALANREEQKREFGGGAPVLLDAINRNGLALFLLANVGTGLINLSLPTMYMPDWTAMVVLSFYAVVICSIAWSLKNRKIWKL